MFLYHPSPVLWSENKISLTDNLANILKEIFLTDLLAAEKKECNNLVNKFNNTEEREIDLVDRRMIKIIWLVGSI